MSEHQEFEELVSLHALGALEAADQRTLEAHLETCSTCRAELAEMRDAAGLLAHASSPAEPSPEVRARILDRVRNDSLSRRTVNEHSVVTTFRPRSAASSWQSFMRVAAVLAFVALLIGVLVLWRHDANSRKEIARLSQQVNQQQDELLRSQDVLARQREALALLNSPSVKKMDLAGMQTAKDARATFVYDRETGHAMLMTSGLLAAPSGMAYEVWFIPKGHAPMPGKTFTVDESGHAMMMDQLPREARDNATIAVTLEPEKGSASPTGAMFLSSAGL